MDLDPKGINNQIKEAIDKRYVTEEDDSLVHFNETGKLQIILICLAVMKKDRMQGLWAWK